jgi:uncharacterized protein
MVAKTVVHFEVPANDPETLSKFYSEVFGWKFQKSPMEEMDYWMISTGPRGKSVGGGMYKKTQPSELPRNYIGVKRIDEHIEAFKSAGGKELVGKTEVPDMGWSFIGTDPEGNLIGLYEAAPPRRSSRRKK